MKFSNKHNNHNLLYRRNNSKKKKNKKQKCKVKKKNQSKREYKSKNKIYFLRRWNIMKTGKEKYFQLEYWKEKRSYGLKSNIKK